MGTYSIAIERKFVVDYEVEADSLGEAEAKARELCQDKNLGEIFPDAVGFEYGPGEVKAITPPNEVVWHCPGCGWVTDEGGDARGHVQECDLVDGSGQAIGRVEY